MKNITFLLMSLFLSLNLLSQNYTPGPVLEAFSELEPNVSSPFWEYREGAYVAMFPHLNGLKKVFFNEEGKWLETRTRLDHDLLPVGVQRFINDHYANADITYIGKVDQPDRSVYRIESEFSKSVVIKLLNEQGDLLNENRIDWSLIPN